jgi:type VI secretion system protein ImpJ
MSWFSKVAWKEGLFLQPQHLQQADRYVEKLIQSRTDVITPYPWGMAEMVVDRDMAQQGRFGLRTAVGIMPDGTPFDAPNAGPLPLPIEVPEDAKGLSVWLTLPDPSQNGHRRGCGDDAVCSGVIHGGGQRKCQPGGTSGGGCLSAAGV